MIASKSTDGASRFHSIHPLATLPDPAVPLAAMVSFNEVYNMYSAKERRNIAIYIAGIMLYKYGLEAVSPKYILRAPGTLLNPR